MLENRRVQRQPCELSARIYVPRRSNPVRCTVTDISTLGAFLRTDEKASLPHNFDLVIGSGTTARACRTARRDVRGIGVEFLHPVRHEIEDILIEHAFKEELVFEALCPPANGEGPVAARLRRSVDAIMGLMERREARDWHHGGIA
ncbi:PilZ domain-containing protein [Methylobacterium iners]|uniref:PilZ domain-containing protein n=1 Tax=Methylobacterium iners TaxID=418707 RepID=UPI001EE36998|nr:PilZ domain-containing protein [Methylobacterium iners]